MVAMSRNNGTFRYKEIQEASRDPRTGFILSGSQQETWIDGCECQMETFVPAKQRVGTDGQMHSYTYDVLIPKCFKGKLDIATPVELTSEDGQVSMFLIQGVDNLNRRYIEIWG